MAALPSLPLAACALVLAVAPGCSRTDVEAALARTGAARRVILITCDTLRADHLGCYGYERPTSPCLDQLARESVLFENAWSAAPLTGPSLSALLAGLPPDQIGVDARANGKRIPASVRTLAEVARDAGLATAAVVSSSVLVRPPPELGDVGLAQGFQFYDDELDASEHNRLVRERDAVHTTDAALRWLAGQAASDARFFLWVHYQDPHGPYRAPEVDQRLFAREHAGERELPAGRDPSGAGQIPDYQLLEDLRQPGAYVDRYDAEIHHFDAELGRLLDGLRGRGLLDDTLLVVTADHGESLGEHDWWFCHGETLQRELVRVPLLVRPPHAGRAPGNPVATGRRETELVSYLDLWPTVLEALELPPVENGGLSLLARDRPATRVALQQLGSTAFGREWYAVTDGRWRLVVPGLASAQLFDERLDPLEQHDLAASEPARVRALRERREHSLADRPAEHHEGVPRERDAATQRALRAAGYTLGADEDPH